MRLAFCWSHVRRRFYELAAAGPAPIASEALKRIGELYAAEAEIRGRSSEACRAARQDCGRPVIDALEPWLRPARDRQPKRQAGRAIRDA